ncbi:MAG: response regulator [Hyphomicrobiales bacterium]|nr:response regulator [Hyphomicrobiales bacterium]
MKHCLIVDDSDVVRKVAARILESMNYVCLEADTATQALETCRRSMPDLIVADSVMPDMSGIELIAALRLDPNGALPMIVYCTAENDSAEIEQALDAGADDYMVKPFDRFTISNLLSEAAERASQ